MASAATIAEGCADSELPRGAREDPGQDPRGVGAERGPDPDFLAPAGGSERHQGVDPRRRQHRDAEHQSAHGDADQTHDPLFASYRVLERRDVTQLQGRIDCGADRAQRIGKCTRTIVFDPPMNHLLEVATGILTDVGWNRSPKQPLAETGWTSSKAITAIGHRGLRSFASMPCHIRSSACREARRLSAPVWVNLTHRRALPPRSGVGSLIVDDSKPFCSSLRRVT
jgi:hypothetical protein